MCQAVQYLPNCKKNETANYGLIFRESANLGNLSCMPKLFGFEQILTP